MQDSAVTLALIAILATVVTGLFKLLSDNTKATKGNTTALESIAQATNKGNREAKERNGHLGDQNIEITKLITKSNKDTLKAIKHISVQKVYHQIINESKTKGK